MEEEWEKTGKKPVLLIPFTDWREKQKVEENVRRKRKVKKDWGLRRNFWHSWRIKIKAMLQWNLPTACTQIRSNEKVPEIPKSALGREIARIHIFPLTLFQPSRFPTSPSLLSDSTAQVTLNDVRLNSQHIKMDHLILGFHFSESAARTSYYPRPRTLHTLQPRTRISPPRVPERVYRGEKRTEAELAMKSTTNPLKNPAR